MLVLSRKVGEELVIADQVRIKVTSIHGKRVRLAISAPEEVSVFRGEIRRQRNELATELEHFVLLGD